MYPWREAYDVMNDMKHEMLEHLALTSEDPINALLALDIGAFGYGRDQERALEVYDKVLAMNIPYQLYSRNKTQYSLTFGLLGADLASLPFHT